MCARVELGRAPPRAGKHIKKKTNEQLEKTAVSLPEAKGWRSPRSGSGLYLGAACAARTVERAVRRSTWSSRSRSAATSSGLRLSTSCPSA
jgi:hypothetical protein